MTLILRLSFADGTLINIQSNILKVETAYKFGHDL